MKTAFARLAALPLLAGLMLGGCTQPDPADPDQAGSERGTLHPAAVVAQTPYELKGEVGAIWSGDTFEIIDPNDGTHCVRIQGVDCPEPGQKGFQESRRLINKLVRNAPANKVTIQVVERDSAQCEISRIRAGDLDIGLELLKAGLAWYTGEEFEGSEAYDAAEQEARGNRLEIWSADTPVPPWTHYENQLASLRNSLSELDTAENEQEFHRTGCCDLP